MSIALLWLLRFAERANDLRVYPMGGRMVGVRAGRCFVGQQARAIAEAGPLELAPDSTSHLYVDETGALHTSTTGLPADRSTFIPLAEIATDAESVTLLTDLRGEALLQAPPAALSGVTASADEINLALDGAASTVTADHLGTLTAGPLTDADNLHRHLSTSQNVDGAATVMFANFSSHASATMQLSFSMPTAMPDPTLLTLDRDTGYLKQSYQDEACHLVGMTSLEWGHSGALAASNPEQLVGVVPVEGEVVAVSLSCGLNMQSSSGGDGIATNLYVNGSALTTSPAILTAGDGVGFQSTAYGSGTQPTLATTGAQHVNRGDLITLELIYAASGTITQQPTNVGVLVVVKAKRPI